MTGRHRISPLWTSFALFAAVRLVLQYAVKPPLPASVLSMYTALVLVAIVVHVTLSDERIREAARPVRRLFLDPRNRTRRNVVLVLFPLVVGMYSFRVLRATGSPPAELRTIHPAPPEEFVGLDNPLRADAERLGERIREGADIYFKNCFFCHGDALDGNGHFADGFNPRPADFTDQGTIAQMPESYIFWRIKTGGPGLPNESQPWNSAMPVWGNFLTDEDIWKVVLFIYQGAGVEPRTWK